MSKVFLGGQERELKFGSYGISIIEEELNCSFFSDFQKLFMSDLKIRNLIALVQGGLAHQAGLLDKRVVAGWIDELMENDKLSDLQAAYMNALMQTGFFKNLSKDQKKIQEKSGSKPKPSQSSNSDLA
jgi:hypothetical protein